ncbi:MAG: terminase large subunit domain-containing protein, partial [Alphaproteobacteria bacterium]
MVRAFHEHRLTVALTARQMGKALALDTPIPTPTGWTTMGAIRVGDQVLGDDGRPVTVSFATDAMYGRRCYEVEFDNGDAITADAEHLWTLNGSYFSDREARTLTTEQIIPLLVKAKQQGQSLYITAADALELPDADLPVEPYTLGVWLGDGNSDDGRFYGHKDDCEEMRGHVMADGYALSEVKADPRNNVRFQTVYGLRPALRRSGAMGDKKRIPDAYLRASRAQRLDLLRGLMDTDGYAAPTGGCEFYQKDRDLAEQVFELVASLGMKPRLKRKIVNGDTYWKVRFATVKHEVFKLARKQAVASMTKGHAKNGRHFFKSIRAVESVPVRCIEVDNESRLFLAGRSMVPTHNTTTAAAYLLWKAMFTPDCTILICANKLNQALEIMDRVRYAYENLPDHIRAGVTEYNKGTVKFDNGSKITARATTADAGRGLSISLLYLDEFAFVQPRMAQEFFTAIQPVLSTGGGCIITSTPKSDEDMFGQIYRGAIDNKDQHGNPLNATGIGKNGYFAVTIPW